MTTELFIRMQLCDDGIIRAVYSDAHGEFVRINGTKVRMVRNALRQ